MSKKYNIIFILQVLLFFFPSTGFAIDIDADEVPLKEFTYQEGKLILDLTEAEPDFEDEISVINIDSGESYSGKMIREGVYEFLVKEGKYFLQCPTCNIVPVEVGIKK